MGAPNDRHFLPPALSPRGGNFWEPPPCEVLDSLQQSLLWRIDSIPFFASIVYQIFPTSLHPLSPNFSSPPPPTHLILVNSILCFLVRDDLSLENPLCPDPSHELDISSHKSFPPRYASLPQTGMLDPDSLSLHALIRIAFGMTFRSFPPKMPMGFTPPSSRPALF